MVTTSGAMSSSEDDLYVEYLKDAARMGIGRKRSIAEFGKRAQETRSRRW